MKQKTSLKQKMNNKGFSLIELLMAITLLAIIIIPVLNSFITSARINKDARQVMIATDVAQTIMEGYSDKSFKDIKASYSLMGINSLSGNYALSTINSDFYNQDVNQTEMTWSAIGNISSNTITLSGTTYNSAEIVSANAVNMTSAYCRDATNWAYMAYNMSSVAGTTSLVRSTDADNMGIFFCYANLPKDGYYFDVVVSILPAAKTATDIFYTYNVRIFVFEGNSNYADLVDRGSKLLMTMEGGIRK